MTDLSVAAPAVWTAADTEQLEQTRGRVSG